MTQTCSPAGKQRLCQGAAGSEHQGSDGGAGRAPRLSHPGSGGGAAETRRGTDCSGVREAELDGARRPHGVHTGAAEGNRPALLCAGCSPHPQQVLLVAHVLFLTGRFNNICLICCFCLLNRLTHYNCSCLARFQASHIIDRFKYEFCPKTINDGDFSFKKAKEKMSNILI